MRSGFLLVSAACVLGSAPARADEFKNPPVIEVRSPGGDLTIRARQGTASVPGLGDVERVYGPLAFNNHCRGPNNESAGYSGNALIRSLREVQAGGAGGASFWASVIMPPTICV